MPNKSNEWTLISVLYLWSTGSAVLTLLASVLAVSLSHIKPSVNEMSERRLLAVFLAADENQNGVLEAAELHRAIKLTGLTDARLQRFVRAIEKHKHRDDGGKVTFPTWFDIVDEVSLTDGLSAYHNAITWGLVRVLMFFERRKKRATILRRADALRRARHGDGDGDGDGATAEAPSTAPAEVKLSSITDAPHDASASLVSGTIIELDRMLRPEQGGQVVSPDVPPPADATEQPSGDFVDRSSSRRNSSYFGAAAQPAAQPAGQPAAHEDLLEDSTELLGRRLSGRLDCAFAPSPTHSHRPPHLSLTVLFLLSRFGCAPPRRGQLFLASSFRSCTSSCACTICTTKRKPSPRLTRSTPRLR